MFRTSTFVASILVVFMLLSQTAYAGVQEDFIASGRQNNILSNQIFIDTKSMTVGEIQAFLVLKGSFLKDYVDISAIGMGRSAAQIIYDAANGAYDAAVGTARGITIDSSTGTVNSKVILVFLQKEQSLVTKTYRDDYALTYAMGYGCPDATGCSGSYYPGFAEQVGWGAWQLRYNHEASQKGVDWWNANYGAGSDSICYVGQVKSFSDYTGTYSVTLTNAATAAIYRYTPHVFDSAYNVANLYDSYFDPSKSILVEFIVTKVFDGNRVMIEDSNRSRGIKLHSTIALAVGDKVDVRGTIAVVDGQKTIATPDEVAKVSSGNALPDYLAVTEKNLVEACNGLGCPVAGLRVTTWGRVIQTPARVLPYIGYYYILVDDGTEVYNPQDQTIGYRVCYRVSDFPDLDRDLVEGDLCIINGVVESVGHTTVPVLTNNLPIIWADSIEKQQ